MRGYFIRLLVWRLSRLGIVAAEQRPHEPKDPQILALFGLLNVRLEAIRKRHDELEPLDNLTDDDLFKPKRSTICSTRGVKEMPFTVDELVGPVAEDSEEEDEPQETVREPVSSSNGQGGGKKSGLKDVAGVARVVSWLKGGLGKNRGSKASRQNGAGTTPDSRIDPFVLDNLPVSPSQAFDDPQNAMDASNSSLSHESAWSAISPPSSVDNDHSMSVDSTDALVTPERRVPRPNSPAFFSFEFENGLAPPASSRPSEEHDGAEPNSSSTSVNTVDTVFPQSPLRQRHSQSVVSPRVSLRFSKRISILPPAALDMLKESGEPVPAIPAQYRQSVLAGYPKGLHPYAIRGLRDYEDALGELSSTSSFLPSSTLR